MAASDPLSRDALDSFWMPFTANRQFKAKPRLLSRASGMHYFTPDGRQILDSVAGLWCVNAGHGRSEITEAVARQLANLDFAPTFQMAHPLAFELANALARIAPAGLDRVFFTNSGSESVDTALKIALAYHRIRGDAARTKLIGRERAYHGVGFGGISVGGIGGNRKTWSASLLPGWTTCLTLTTSSAMLSRTVSPPTARNWRTSWSACWRCTIRRRSPR